jgi:hypothetical protein
MSTNLHPLFAGIVGDHFPRMRGLRSERTRHSCELCESRDICDVYPCPKVGPEDIDTAVLEAAKE